MWDPPSSLSIAAVVRLLTVLAGPLLCNVLPSDSLGSFVNRLELPNTLDIIDKDIFFEIIEPEYLRYTYRTRPAKDFGLPFDSKFEEKGALLVPVDPPTACTTLTNAPYIKGNVAFIQRGECSFVSKTIAAEEAGARAVIIADNQNSDELFTEMIDDDSGRQAHIPATFLVGKSGFMIRRTLERLNLDYAVINIPVNLTYVPLNEFHQPPWLTW